MVEEIQGSAEGVPDIGATLTLEEGQVQPMGPVAAEIQSPGLRGGV